MERLKIKFVSVGTIITSFLFVLGVTLVVYGGPCYVQTSYMSATELGCSEDEISPPGASCPQVAISITQENASILGCRPTQNPFSIGVGTSGNESSGKMEQTVTSKICFYYNVCTQGIPYPMGLPFADTMVYNCNLSHVAYGYATKTGIEPSGADCKTE